METRLTLLDDVFDKQWLGSRKELQFALGEKQNYRIQVNQWLQFFKFKNWLDDNLIKRLRTASNWTSYYSKINELRAGYFFEKKLKFILSKYESPTINDKNVEFKGRINNFDIFIEVKTPLNLDRKRYKGGWGNDNDIICEVLDKAIKQLPDNASTIIVLSDDLRVPILDDSFQQNIIWELLDTPDYQKVSAVCVLGDISIENMYEMRWAVNDNAKYPIDKDIFSGFKKIYQLL